MGKYEEDNDETKVTKGKITLIKLFKTFEKKDGGEYKAHVIKLKDEEGEEHTFKILTKSKIADYVKKYEEGDKISVKTGGQWNNVLAVFKDGEKKGGSYAKTNSRKEYDPTGAIQGMILKASIDVASAEGNTTVENILKAAKRILDAKEKVDKLVVQALKPKDDEDDSDDDSSNDKKASRSRSKKSVEEDEESDDKEADREDSEDDEKPKKKKKSSDEEDSPY